MASNFDTTLVVCIFTLSSLFGRHPQTRAKTDCLGAFAPLGRRDPFLARIQWFGIFCSTRLSEPLRNST
jgi:hypothetical protein